MPHMIPIVMLLLRWNSGTIIITPMNITQAQRTSAILIRSPKIRGSRNVIKRGNVENVRTPIATVETWMERKKVVQWTASKKPAAARAAMSRPESSLMLLPLYLKRAYMAVLAKKTLPSAIMTAGSPTYLAKSPERPKRTTAICISIRLLVFSCIYVSFSRRGAGSKNSPRHDRLK